MTTFRSHKQMMNAYRIVASMQNESITVKMCKNM